MKLPRRPLLFALAVLALSTAAAAEVPVPWSSSGPPGGVVVDVAVDPADPQRILVATAQDGLLVGDGRRGAWRPSDAGLDWSAVNSVHFAPSDPRIVYAGTGVDWYGGNGVYRSDDGGRCWRPVHAGFEGVEGQVLAIDPVDPDVVYAARNQLSEDLLWRTLDGGQSWQSLSQGLRGDDFPIRLLVLPGEGPGMLFLETIYGLYRRRIAGEEPWERIFFSNHLVFYRGVMVFDEQRHELLFAEPDRRTLWVSRDLGASFDRLEVIEIDDQVSDSVPTSMMIGEDGRLYFGTPSGEVWSRPLGEVGAWEAHRIPLEPFVMDLMLHPSGRLFAGTWGAGVVASEDRGAHWEHSTLGMRTSSLWTAEPHPTRPDTLFASTFDYGLERSRDGGRNWRRLPLPSRFVRELVFFPGAADRMLATTGGSPGMYLSENGGNSWRAVGPLGSQAFGVTFVDEVGDVVIAGFGFRGFWRSTDRGETWAEWGPEVDYYADHVVVDPSDAQHMFAVERGFVSRLHVTEDGGQNWSLVPFTVELLTMFGQVLFDPVDPGVVWMTLINAESKSRRLQKSVDGGTLWQSVALPDGIPGILDLGFDPAHPEHLYFIANGGGLWRSTDRGARWEELLLPGLEEVPLQTLSFVPTAPAGATHLLLASAGAGAVRAEVSEKAALPLFGSQFDVTVSWRAHDGSRGSGRPVPLVSDTGAFWFFRPENLELFVKVLDGRPVNDSHWVFWGSLSDVEYTFEVADRDSGEVFRHVNRIGRLRGGADIRAFPQAASSAAPLTAVAAAAEGEGDLLLNGDRFRVRVDWQIPDGESGSAVARPLTDDTGSFWFFRPDNLEVMVKVLDGRPVNGNFWVFLAGLTNLGLTITVDDLVGGSSRTYTSAPGEFAAQADVAAF